MCPILNNNWWNNSSAYFKSGKKNFPKLKWVPDHVGITVQKMVDQLAKEESTKEVGSHLYVGQATQWEDNKMYEGEINEKI